MELGYREVTFIAVQEGIGSKEKHTTRQGLGMENGDQRMSSGGGRKHSRPLRVT